MGRKRKQSGTPQPEGLANPLEGNPLPPTVEAAGKPFVSPGPDDYPLELVASVAARLAGEAHDFRAVADRALALLDACKEALADRGPGEEEMLALAARYDAEHPDGLSYVQLVDYVTGKRDSTDAEEAFTKYARQLMLEAESYDFAREFFGNSEISSKGFNYKLDRAPAELAKGTTEEELKVWLDKLRAKRAPGFIAQRMKEGFSVWQAAKREADAKARGELGAKERATRKEAAAAAKKALEG